jgi:hypothetical protein
MCKWTYGVLHVTWSNEWSCGKESASCVSVKKPEDD